MQKSIEFYRNCPVGKYHNFKVEIELSDENAQVETCRFCNVRKAYKFNAKGQLVDNEQYFKDHIRFFAQPSQAVYYDINPDAEEALRMEAKKKELFDARQADRSDRFKHAIKKALE